MIYKIQVVTIGEDGCQETSGEDRRRRRSI